MLLKQCWILISGLCLMTFMFSCTETEIEPTTDIDDIESCRPHFKKGEVFMVMPQGREYDAANIQQAFEDAKIAGPGSVVKLAEGTFYLNDWIEVYDFEGFFKGAGMDKTLLIVDEPIDYSGWRDLAEVLITFRRGNIHMSQMTIDIKENDPVENQFLEPLFNKSLGAVISFTGASTADPDALDTEISSYVNNVAIYGSEGGFFGFNVVNLISRFADYSQSFTQPYDIIGGKFVVMNSKFSYGAAAVASDTDGTHLIIRNQMEKILFGMTIEKMDNSLIKIHGNHIREVFMTPNPGFFQYTAGIYVMQESTNDLSRFIISHNKISDLQNAIGIRIIDNGVSEGNKALALSLWGNHVKASKNVGEVSLPAMMLGTQGARINRNLMLGYPGWDIGTGAVEFLDYSTSNIFGDKNKFPGSSVCEQVKDLGDNIIVDDCED